MTAEDQMVWVDDVDIDVCWRLMAGRCVGRIAFLADGEPVVLPVTHAVDGRTIVFRTGQTSILEALADGAAVAFEVDDADASAETGWSVLVRGRASEIRDEAGRTALADLALRPWAPGARDHWIRIEPTSVTGRAISRQRAGGTFLPYMPPD